MSLKKKVGKSLLKRGAKAVVGEIPGASLIMEGVGFASDISKKEHSTPAEMRERKPSLTQQIIWKELYGSEKNGTRKETSGNQSRKSKSRKA